MEDKSLKRNTIVLAIITFLILGSAAWAQEQTPEAYTGVAMGTGGMAGGKSITFDFRVTQYTTDEEVQKFAQLLKDKGTDALGRALDKENKGRISVVGSTGTQIAIARKRTQGADTIITIVTPRILPFAELYHNGRSTDYSYGYLQVKLDSEGKGSGQIMAAAKIRFDKKSGQYQIESFGNQYIKATNVRPSK
jgi:hypothetical protein